ncbi:tRNA-specific adenosine deaminase subunit Tad2p [[Candida] railenensis]|uniref:tRNA-specific adenosine deaminase subunit Tad2p n=1 Tax=[Candida] railenensis TaxID=45579 RepID=A0A9P0W0Y3_9ASCO|nr:tRNA-specific adenosine deaminase subunit Tad2p [[Candida] railenensis]
MDLTEHFQRVGLSLFVAFKALSINETPVACILVSKKSSKVISIGYNDTNRSLNGTRHAEFIAIDYILDNVEDTFPVDDLILYVTVEPCIMCASALKQVGIQCVVYGCGNDRFGGNGTVLSLHENNYGIIPGILRTEAIQLLRNFYIQENESAPDPKIKKNKELENKLYPEMDYGKYMNESEFIKIYGLERLNSTYINKKEITPVIGKGYRVSDLVSLDDVMGMPGLENMYSRDKKCSGPMTREAVAQDLDSFYRMFYAVDDEGDVTFGTHIKIIGSENKIEFIKEGSDRDTNEVKEPIENGVEKKRRKLSNEGHLH